MLPSNGKMFTGPLPRNGTGVSTHLAVVAKQRLYALLCVIIRITVFFTMSIVWYSKNPLILSVINRRQNPLAFA
jgi:hypothetical protein